MGPSKVLVLPFGSERPAIFRDRAFGAGPNVVEFSPDGRHLLFINSDANRLYAYDLQRRRAVALLAGPVAHASWSPDGRRIALGRLVPGRAGGAPAGGLAIFDLTTRDVRLITGDGFEPAWSPDGERIAFSTSRDGEGQSCSEEGCEPNRELDVIDADGSNRRRLTHTARSESRPSWSSGGTRLVALLDRSMFNGRSGLVTLGADGSCYRELFPVIPGAHFTLGPNAWRPTRGSARTPRGC